MTKKTLWDKVGGMDERFKVSCNDVDYCLKIRQENMLVVYDAYSVWHHYQSKSRGLDDTKAKLNRLREKSSSGRKSGENSIFRIGILIIILISILKREHTSFEAFIKLFYKY
jgi:GT2 family glycosyltransferase